MGRPMMTAIHSEAPAPTRRPREIKADRWDLNQDRSNWRAALAENGRASLDELVPIAASLGRGTLEGEDLVAEAFERVIRQWSVGRGPRSGVHGYVLNSIRNRVIDERRSPRSAVVDIPEGYSGHSTIGNPERELELKEMRSALHAALDQLPETSREVIIEACVRERKVSEIAEDLETTSGIVSQRIYRAKRTLRKILQDDPRVNDGLGSSARSCSGSAADSRSSLVVLSREEHTRPAAS